MANWDAIVADRLATGTEEPDPAEADDARIHAGRRAAWELINR